MAEHYGERVAFRMVYIAEAHASDVWQVAANERDEVLILTPSSLEDRLGVAERCIRQLDVRFPAVVDGMDDAVERAYTAWPDRLYVIDADGRVAHKSGPGPFGFRPEGVKETLERLLGE